MDKREWTFSSSRILLLKFLNLKLKSLCVRPRACFEAASLGLLRQTGLELLQRASSASMVLLQPSLTLNLKHLASHGAVISAEQQVRAHAPSVTLCASHPL